MNWFLQQYKTIQFSLFCLLAMLPLLPKGIQSGLFILIVTIALTHVILKKKVFWNAKKSKDLVGLGMLFFLYTISFFYSENKEDALKFILRLLPTILLPLVFLKEKKSLFSGKKIEKILLLFLITVLIKFVWVHFNIYEMLYAENKEFWNIRQQIEVFTETHGTYLSIWLGIAALIQGYFLKKNSNNIYIVLISICSLSYLGYWLYVVGSRMPLLATLIALFLLLLRSFEIQYKIIVPIAVAVFIIFSFTFKNQIKFKIEELTSYNTAIPVGKYESTYPMITNENIRSVIYHCALEDIKKSSLIGYGIGDVDDHLQKCYDVQFNHTDTFKRFYFNTHSQYLLILMATGFIGFFIYIASLIFMFQFTNRKTDLYTCFLVLLLGCFCFENVLSRHDGVFAFSFFSTLLYFWHSHEKTSDFEQL